MLLLELRSSAAFSPQGDSHRFSAWRVTLSPALIVEPRT